MARGRIALPLHDEDSECTATSTTPRHRVPSRLALFLALPLLAVASFFLALPVSLGPLSPLHTPSVLRHAPQCPVQGEALVPRVELALTDADKNRSIGLLSEAVRLATVSYDDNGKPTEDARWAPFFDFQKWLVKSYPAVFNHPAVTHEYVNTLGLLTTVQGSDPSLKPLLLLSHYDVTPAPVETHDRWTHPPFSGHNDGKFIWGRGASDDKTLFIAQYTALSALLSSGFTPRRTILLSHGFDEEEVFARQGAVELGAFLEGRYGKDSVLLIVDEGTGLEDDVWGADFAVPSSSEKGYLDVRITVGTPGGHSSVPPPHSGIGIMSDLVHALEANPYPLSFKDDDPVLGYLACAAAHSPKFPRKWTSLLADADNWPLLAEEFGTLGAMQRALVTTTQAIDVIAGGSKVNSLPEEVTALMNHRIAFTSSVAETQAHIRTTLAPVAAQFGLAFSAFENTTREELGAAYVRVETLGAIPLEPAPRSPLAGGVWDLFSGSIKYAFPTQAGTRDRVVSPSSSTGNTDTKAYHALSRSVFRFKGDLGGGGNAHTVDERAPIAGHYAIINWIHTLIQNADAYEGEE